MDIIKEFCFRGGRSLENSSNIRFIDCYFSDGESAVKSSCNIELNTCTFEWKYPLWYCNNISLNQSIFLLTARSGIWYTKNLHCVNCIIEAPKTFRYCSDLYLDDVSMPHAEETLWCCENVSINNSTIVGDYIGQHSNHVSLCNVHLIGNYCFDGGKNITVTDSTLVSKDAFWNCENVTIKNSTIIGEYLGWNSKNITFINCLIQSTQGFSRIEGLTITDCRIIKSCRLFELSENINADISSDIGGVFNPKSGKIVANKFLQVDINEKIVDPGNTQLVERASMESRK